VRGDTAEVVAVANWIDVSVPPTFPDDGVLRPYVDGGGVTNHV